MSQLVTHNRFSSAQTHCLYRSYFSVCVSTSKFSVSIDFIILYFTFVNLIFLYRSFSMSILTVSLDPFLLYVSASIFSLSVFLISRYLNNIESAQVFFLFNTFSLCHPILFVFQYFFSSRFLLILKSHIYLLLNFYLPLSLSPFSDCSSSLSLSLSLRYSSAQRRLLSLSPSQWIVNYHICLHCLIPILFQTLSSTESTVGLEAFDYLEQSLSLAGTLV